MPPLKATRVRAKMPKVKTGCRTCKIRRVKCDERKPHCQRCTRFGIGCDGYEDPPPLASESRALTPTRSTNGTVPIPVAPLRRQFFIPPLILSSRTPFESQQEYQYYRHFRNEVTIDLSGGFDPELWNHVILQACETEPSLRDLAVSVAAISRASTTTFSNPDLQYALRKYGKALRGIQDTVSRCPSSPDSVRIALISSILIFFFQNLHGSDIRHSIRHLQSALHLLRERLSRTPRPYQHRLSASPTPDLEDDLIKALVRLDSSLQGRMDNPNPSVGNILGIDCTTEPYDPPPHFTGISDARRYLEHLGFRAMAHLPQEIPAELVSLPSSASEFRELNTVRPMYLPPRAFAVLAADLERWNASFKAVWNFANTAAGEQDFIAATTLMIHAVCLKLHFSISLPGVQTFPDTVIPEAEEIVTLSRRVVEHPRFRKGFVLQNGIVSALFIVVFTRQRRKVRTDALEVLRKAGNRREVGWDAEMVVRVGEWVLELEDRLKVRNERGEKRGESGEGCVGGCGESGSEVDLPPPPNDIGQLGSWVVVAGMNSAGMNSAGAMK